MRKSTLDMTAVAAILAIVACAWAATAQDDRPRRGGNVLTGFLDWADIHPVAEAGRLTVFPISLSRDNGPLRNVLTMRQAMDRGVLAVEELTPPRVSEARFVNKSEDRFVFLMAGELVAGGRQNRTLRTDALLGPQSSADLPLYCVEKGRWAGEAKFSGSAGVAPQTIREQAASGAGQQAVWDEVARANSRMEVSTPSDDLNAAMTGPATARKLGELRDKIIPRLPRGCVGIVVAHGSRIVGADLFNSPELFSAMRQKVLDSYLSQYGLGPRIVDDAGRDRMPAQAVSQEQVQQYLRGCYDGRFEAGALAGVGRIWHLRGRPAGQTLTYGDDHMIHTSLTSPRIIPVRPTPLPMPMPRPRAR
jgi:hypothetical protein